MRILITGADGSLGEVALGALGRDHELRLTGAEALGEAGFQNFSYTAADLREPEEVAPLVEGMEVVVHLAPYQAHPVPDVASEGEILDRAARGTFVLLHAALKAGVRRVVMASRLELMVAYPAEYVVEETWKPLPDATAGSLAPYMAELTLREFVRAEEMVGICLRLGELGSDPEGTTPVDAARAIQRAVEMELSDRKYRWWLYHLCSTDRYRLSAAAQTPFSFTREASVLAETT